MDDPWDVKSVRKSGQYTSCMKINGVPLLPPVLSKECRTEMQYYKLLAKEVEKRISILQPYIESDTESVEDRTDVPEIVECEQEYDESREPIEADTNQEIVQATDELIERVEEKHTLSPQHTEVYNFHTKHSIITDSSAHPHLIVDFNLNINETITAETGSPEREISTSPSLSEPVEIPERDYNCTTHKPIELIQDTETTDLNCDQKKETIIEEIVNFSFSLGREASLDSAIQESISQEGPPSLSSKSFTGSLNNIHLSNDSGLIKPLVRQHSYTILNPSPQLLAHLEVQSLNLGVDMSSISMSESLTNLSPGKKRRSWDLETAKAKWSNMALELKQTNLSRPNTIRSTTKQLPRTVSPSRPKCVAAARTKYSSLSLKHTVKNEAIPRARTSSPPRSTSPSRTRTSSPVKDVPSGSTIILEEPMTFRMSKEPKIISVVKEPVSPKNIKKGPFGEGPKPESPKREIAKSPINNNTPQKTSTPQPSKNSELVKAPGRANSTNKSTPKHLPISEADDPATKVRELYEKIQKQQLLQMASLVEKQKREQMLLQQAFEDQNNLLFKQLKTICPKSPDKIKEAWVERSDKVDRGPVSLSQLINHSSPLASTLTDSNKYISYCDDILKKSKDISSTLKTNGNQMNSKTTPKTNSTGNKTRPKSPLRKNTPTSRKLNYDTSASSERDYEIVLTDRTNDTLADLNVTFPSDTEEGRGSSRRAHSPLCAEVTVIHRTTPLMSTDSAIKRMEQTIQKSINSCSLRSRNVVNCQPTARQRAAATTIVAYAKGFLVRRLMKTTRVQATVQTIKDALLCALQLHQDREGIRGADVDLHRRLIQQITAACYSLHDTFITSSASERCALLAAERARRAHAAARPPHKHRHSDVMSQSHSGAFPPRHKRHSASPSLMTQSNYETWRSEARRGRRPWR